MNEALEAVVSTELDALGFDLVELRRGGTKNRPLLDVRIDRRDGSKVNVDDCARASRAIEAKLDAEPGALVPERYVLEVSSPGAERALTRPADWRRFVGRSANVRSEALGGKVEVEIVGLEGDPGGEVVVMRDPKGIEHRVPFAGIKDARLAFHWKRSP